MKLENCKTEGDFFGWYLNKCRKEGWNPNDSEKPLGDDLHWKDPMECLVPVKYAEQVRDAIAYHVYEAWVSATVVDDQVEVGTFGYYAYGN